MAKKVKIKYLGYSVVAVYGYGRVKNGDVIAVKPGEAEIFCSDGLWELVEEKKRIEQNKNKGD